MTKIRVVDENTDADKLIPPAELDGSGIGVNYTDAYIKAMNVDLDGGLKITCKRKGLKILLTIGERQGEALMRRLEHGPDVKRILREALKAATLQAESTFVVEDGVIYFEAPGGSAP